MNAYRLRRTLAFMALIIAIAVPLSTTSIEDMPTLREVISPITGENNNVTPELRALEVKGRAQKTGYERSKFGSGWDSTRGCDTRNRILARDLREVVKSEDSCKVASGWLDDPYTGKDIRFVRGPDTSDEVQIDHVVALSNAWQTGAQQMSMSERVIFSNDPLNLLAVSGSANEQKSDGDAATWLPSYKPFRCQYVSRQIAVKQKYKLWVTPAERAAMQRVLDSC